MATTESTFDRVSAQMRQPSSALAGAFAAYHSGKMSPEDGAKLEAEVRAGRIVPPQGFAIKTDKPVVPQHLIDAYQSGQMTPADAEQMKALITGGQSDTPTGAPLVEPQKPGLLQRVREAVTGEQRRTETTERLPDWTGMPELNSLSLASAKTGLGTLLSDPRETAQIIQTNFPQAQVRQDDKGNYVIRSSVDGQEYAIKPGFRVSDIPRAIGALAAFTPAGRATSAVGAGIGAAATQGMIEATQAATGGEFNPGAVATSGALGAAAPIVAGVANAGIQRVRQVLSTAGREAPSIEAGAGVVPGQGAPQIASELPVQPVPAAVAPPPVIAPQAATPTMPAAELAQTAKRAAEGGLGSSRAKRILAGQAAPDAETVASAKRLGIEDYLQPDHVTTNQAFRELSQAVKSIPGSAGRANELQGLEQVAKRADDLITELGGTKDLSAVSQATKDRMQSSVSSLEKQADALYAKVREELPLTAQAPAENVLQFIRQRAKELGGEQNLSPMEKRIAAKLSDKGGAPPTYALLDDVRRDVGAVTSRSGPFKDADTGLARRLYALLSEDQGAAATKYGAKEVYDAARAAVVVRKGIEDDMVSLFGKSLDRSLVGELSNAVTSLSKGDSDKLARLIANVPKDAREQVVVSGLTSAFGRNARDGTLNFNTFSKWWDGLEQNQQAKTVLMSNLPKAAQKQLEDLARVSRGIAMSSRERILTGRIEAVRQEIQGPDSLMANLYGVARRAATGAAAEAITTPLGMPGAGLSASIASAMTKGKPDVMKAADAIISSPEFVAMARATTKPEQQAAAARLAKSGRFEYLRKLAGNPPEMTNGQRWVLTALQSKQQGEQK